MQKVLRFTGDVGTQSRRRSHDLPSLESRFVYRVQPLVSREIVSSERPSANANHDSLQVIGAFSGPTESVQDVRMSDVGFGVAAGGVRPINDYEPIAGAENVGDVEITVADPIALRQTIEDLQSELGEAWWQRIGGLDLLAEVIL